MDRAAAMRAPVAIKIVLATAPKSKNIINCTYLSGQHIFLPQPPKAMVST